MPQQEYPSNNYKDGMKVNARILNGGQDAIIYQQAKHSASLLNDYNYGLLPVLNDKDKAVKLLVTIDNQQQMQVHLHQCDAITRGGYYIDFDKDTGLGERKLIATIADLSAPFQELKLQSAQYYIVLTVNPYQREAFGLADPLEQPARIPYTRSSYYLSLLPEEDAVKNLLGLFQLPVGKLIIKNQRVFLDEEYIPPCNAVNSHDDLKKIHEKLESFYTEMERYSVEIVQKILKRKQPNEIASIVQKLCENLIPLIAVHITHLKTLSLRNPPVELVCMLSSFARTVKNTLDCNIGAGYETLMKYFHERCDINQARIENCITTLSNHQYDHLDINYSIEKMFDFTQIITKLFFKLKELNYIGESGPDGWVITEHLVNNADKFSFSD